MLSEGYDIFTVNDPSVAAELKVARPIACPLTRTLSVAYEHNQDCILLSHLKAIENITNNSLLRIVLLFVRGGVAKIP